MRSRSSLQARDEARLALEYAAETAPRPWTPHPYQIKGVRWLLSHAGAGLFADPGLGKTSINLAALKILKQEGELQNGALVCCDLRPLYNVWDPEGEDSEPRKWTDFHDLRFSLLHDRYKDEAFRKRADVYLINPDGLPWYFSKIRRDALPNVLIIDESTAFKNATTQRFKTLRPWLPAFSRRWINTGTPSPNGYLDLFGQIYVCDLGNALGQYITHYRRNYFDPTGYGGYDWVLQEDGEKRIQKAIEPLIMRLAEKDYLKLPPLHGALIHSKGDPAFVRVKLPPKAMGKFRQLEEIFFADFEDGRVTASNAATKHGKLRQAANGGIYADRDDGNPDDWRGPRKWIHLHDEKTDAVVELLDWLDDRSGIVAIEFKHDVERLRMHKRLRNVLCIGEGTPREDRLIAADWNRGKVGTLLVNPQSFSKGSNMQRGGDMLIYHSMIWNLEHYDQLIRRFWRQGRKRPFYVRHIIAEGTQDIVIARALQSKNTSQRGLLDALRKYSLRRPRRKA